MEITRRRAGLMLVVLLGVAVQISIARDNAIRIVQSDAHGLLLEYSPKFLMSSKVKYRNGEAVRYQLEGGSPLPQQKPGEPELSVATFIIRFLGIHDNSVELVNVEYENEQNVLLAPEENAQEMNPAAYQRDAFFPQQVARLAHIGETQGAILGDLQICPMQYNPAQRLLRKYSRDRKSVV